LDRGAKIGSTKNTELAKRLVQQLRCSIHLPLFMGALHREKYVPEACNELQLTARQAVRDAGIAQEKVDQFREDLRIAVGQITYIMSGGEFSASLYLIRW
jgi:hypothetical protein